MSIDDLRHHLRDQAAEIDPTQPVPLTAVRRRREQIHRRRIATVTAAVAMVTAITAVAVGNNLGTSHDGAPATTPSAPSVAPPDGLPSRAPQTSAKDHVQNGIRYRADVAGDTLDTAAVGKVGEGKVGLLWNPDNRSVVIRVFCTRPVAPGAEPALVVLRIDGRAITTQDCSQFPVTDPGSTPTARLDPKELFPHGTSAADISVQIIDPRGSSSPSPDQQVGFGIYNSSDNRSISADPPVFFPELIEHQGHLYRLNDGLMTADFSPTMTQQGAGAETPAFKPFLVLFGTAGVPTEHTFEIAGVSGGHTFTVAPAYGPLAGFKSIAVKPQAAGQVEVRPVGPDPTQGVVALAIYVPAD